ncbi:putative serine protease PepD [Barrientosiimonas humi]|uniref:Putative serine protease PepD n=1 Tax=Barrientosiimonas humi TaxID=999931 RepID=A0A542X950_9MICO|nr:trypsin-like peptidase domain-containing protein [Barrientosiimonas humi]TQL32361.1 putative serine protease PepD [Barrientosiimonas humi]CAG7572352.1 Putative serine protease HtrA [Barrientosiimonas humi]
MTDDRSGSTPASGRRPDGTAPDTPAGSADPTPPPSSTPPPTTQPIDLDSTGAIGRAPAPAQQPDGSAPQAPRWSTRPSQGAAPLPGARRPGGPGGPGDGRTSGAPGPVPPGATGAAAAPASSGVPATAATPVSAAAPPAAPPRRGRGGLVAGAVALALLAGGAGGLAGAALSDRQQESAAQSGQVTDPDVSQVAQSVLPGVVTLRVGESASSGGVGGSERSGTGSGFVIRQDGYILTNNHVATAAGENGKITVVFADGEQVPATLVGRDASYDLAVVKVDKTGLPTLLFGSSDRVKVGNPVIAVGAPLGLDSTVTTGIVSALNRPVVAGQSQDQRSYINAVQTDAAINPGNSGGPLVDERGQVVGINTAIARVPGSSSGSGGNIGLGFAIPADTAKRTADQLIKSGKAEHPAIGALLDQSYTGEGARITGSGSTPAVTPGGPADKAGLKDGDVVLSIDGRKVTSADMLIVTIRSKAVGDRVRLLVRSGGSERTVEMVLTAGAS